MGAAPHKLPDARPESQSGALHRGTASIRPGTRVYAVGDVHGSAEPLARMLSMLRFDAAQSGPLRRRVAVFLGDYVDRGLESRQVIDLLLANPLPGFETVFLKGNHEAWLLAFLDDAAVGREWLAAGGKATLLSYRVAASPPRRTPEHLERLRRALAAAIPDTHRAFLNGLATRHIEDGYAFVHGGIRPGTALSEQREEDLLWSHEEFLNDRRDHGKVIVHGHTITPAPDESHNRIGIDTGAYATGRLTSLVLEGTSRRFLST